MRWNVMRETKFGVWKLIGITKWGLWSKKGPHSNHNIVYGVYGWNSNAWKINPMHNKPYWPWNGGLPWSPAEDGGEFKPLRRSGIGWIFWVVNPLRWAIPCSFVCESSEKPPINFIRVWIVSWVNDSCSFFFLFLVFLEKERHTKKLSQKLKI